MSQKVENMKRRRGPDIWVKLISWFEIISWVILFITLYVITKAKPQVENFFDKFLKVSLRKTWDLELAQYAFYLMIILLTLSICALVVNSKRHRRKSDRYSFTLILMSMVSFIGIVIYTLYF